jgi:hypothetical protein
LQSCVTRYLSEDVVRQKNVDDGAERWLLDRKWSDIQQPAKRAGHKPPELVPLEAHYRTIEAISDASIRRELFCEICTTGIIACVTYFFLKLFHDLFRQRID